MKILLPTALSIALMLIGSTAFAQLPHPAASAEVSPPRQSEVRRHRLVKSASGQDDYAITEVRRRIGPTDQTLLLVDDRNGDSFMLTYERNDDKHFKSYEIRQLVGEEFLRIDISSAPTGANLPPMNGQAPAHSARPEAETLFEYTTAGNGRISGFMSHWRDPETAREWRSRLRSMLSPQFLEQLEIMQAFGFLQAAAPNFAAFLVDDLMYRNRCPAPELAVTDAVPDCNFDKKFGFACSDDQKARAEKARGEKPPATGAY